MAKVSAQYQAFSFKYDKAFSKPNQAPILILCAWRNSLLYLEDALLRFIITMYEFKAVGDIKRPAREATMVRWKC